MPKQVCVNCSTEFKIEKNGVYVVEMFNNPPQPYKIWSADLWKCPKCKQEIIAGFGMQALAEHFQEHFNGMLEKIRGNSDIKVYEDYE